MENPLQQLDQYGQSIWLDYIRRNLLLSGELDRLITEDGLKGMTSNPDIFQKAIAGSKDYADALQLLSNHQGITAEQAYELLALEDIGNAADRLRPVFDATNGRDGYISFEVSPRLANDTQATVREARRLWRLLGRPNVMIKVPATAAGIPAIEALLAEGININITLLFSTAVYAQVAEAYIRALESRAKQGGDLGTVASVASIFVSRIDSAVDNALAARLESGATGEQKQRLERIAGEVAIANSKIAYQHYKALFSGNRWQSLADRGARTQRLLWASTGVKNPAYRDVRYIEELIGRDTVNTVPPATMDAFRDHGEPRKSSVEQDVESARDVLQTLAQLGISLDEITDRLLQSGVRKFVDAYDKLLGAVAKALAEAVQEDMDQFSYELPPALGKPVDDALEDWRQNDKVRRLWARDPWLWTGGDEAGWLEWLEITASQLDHLGDLRRISHAAEGNYYEHAVLLGMGGSSLAPEVFRQTFGDLPDHPDLKVLDSTDPAQIKAVEESIDLHNTLFLVASKSGTTLEPKILMDYFFQRVRDTVGEDQAPTRFAVVTDPGSQLVKAAKDAGFRHVFYGRPGIGGRYSALSNFGLIPAAGIGVDVGRFLDNALAMVEACAACVPARDNPGVVLGCILAVSAQAGRDKVTLIASPGIASIGAWLEQLLAESTGKQGKGLIPVDREAVGMPEVYGNDRLFVYLRLDKAADSEQDAAVDRLEQAGMPVVRIRVTDVYNLGQEFFRWQIATAVTGSILGINPFNQPDVEASKIATRRLTEEYESSGSLPVETAFAEDENLRLYADARNTSELGGLAGDAIGVAEIIRAHLGRVGKGDYVALLAYLARNEAHDRELQQMRHSIRDTHRVATCVGFGPRFLHSTGQAYKGGPNSGVFLQITCDDAVDLPVPGHKYSFGAVKAAQATGDFQVLTERGRRALRVHLGEDTVAGLQKLREIIAHLHAS